MTGFPSQKDPLGEEAGGVTRKAMLSLGKRFRDVTGFRSVLQRVRCTDKATNVNTALWKDGRRTVKMNKRMFNKEENSEVIQEGPDTVQIS